MIYKFTEQFEIDNNTYYAILKRDGDDYNSVGVILGEVIDDYREKYAEYYLTSMKQPNSVEDLVKDL